MYDRDGEDPPNPTSELESSDLETNGAAPDPDEMYRALSKRERRRTLYALLDDPMRSVDELSDLLAGWESTSCGVVGPGGRRRITSRLHHVHLPVLEDVGLIEYDTVSGVIRLSTLAAPVEELLQFAYEYDHAMGSDSSL